MFEDGGKPRNPVPRWPVAGPSDCTLTSSELSSKQNITTIKKLNYSSQKTHCFSITRTYRLMLLKESSLFIQKASCEVPGAVVTRPTELGTKNECADEDKRKLTRPTESCVKIIRKGNTLRDSVCSKHRFPPSSVSISHEPSRRSVPCSEAVLVRLLTRWGMYPGHCKG